jgi:hypothetical protein
VGVRPKTETRDAVHGVDRDLAVLRVEVGGIERRVASIELQAAAANESALAAARGTKTPWLRIIAVVVATTGVFGGGVASILRGPSRNEFESSGEAMERSLERLRETAAGFDREAVKTRGMVETLQRDLGKLEVRIEQLQQYVRRGSR